MFVSITPSKRFQKNKISYKIKSFAAKMNKSMLNLVLYCRVCVIKSEEMQSLNEEFEPGVTIANLIGMCTQVSLQENEEKPKSICKICMKKLETAYEFYNLIRSSEEKLDALISSNLLTNDLKEENCLIESFDNNVADIKELKPSKDDLCQTEAIGTEDIFVDELNVTLLCDENEVHGMENPSPVEIVQDKRKRGRVKQLAMKPKNVKTRRSSIINKRGEFECYICRLGFSSMLRVKLHLQEHDTITKCRVCMKTLNRCEYVQHLCKGKEIDCQYCSKPFSTTISLIKHINKSHKNHKNYKCYNCARAFHTKMLLEIHKPSHDAEELKFICDLCGSRFRTRYQIKEHMEITHTDKRCNYSSLIKHV